MILPARAYVVGLAFVLGLAGCGTAGQPSAEASGDPSSVPLKQPASPTTVRNGEPLLSCGDIGFPPLAMTEGVDGLANREEIGEALSQLVEDAGIDAPTALQGGNVDDAEWFVLGGDEKQILVATGPWDADGPGESAQTVGLTKTSDGWKADSWGDCNLRLVAPTGLTWAQVRAEKVTAPAKATTLTVFVSEIECTTARDPDPYLQEPVVMQTAATVTVYWTSTPPVGDQGCPGNPEVERVIELDAPLGQRELLDGSTWPPTPVFRRS